MLKFLLCSAVVIGMISADAKTALNLETAYSELSGIKALAVVPTVDGSEPSIIGMADSQAQDVAAATQALQECETNKTRSATPATASCELIRLNDETITTGFEIRQRVPSSPHPLYLWRYQSATSTVDLAGSIHILKPSLYPLPEAVNKAFDAADTLVLEVNVGDRPPKELALMMMQRSLLPEQQTLADVLPNALLHRVHAALSRYGIAQMTVDRARPAVVMNQIVLSRLLSLGYNPAQGVEQHFMNRLGGRRVLELETLESQLDLLFNQPIATQVALLRDTLDQQDSIEPLMTQMVLAWLAGDDKTFLQLFEQQAGDSQLAKEFNRLLLDERNVGMADKIQTYLQQPGHYFVLVGAAHLIGDQGVVQLLRRRNVEGKRIWSR